MFIFCEFLGNKGNLCLESLDPRGKVQLLCAKERTFL